jgi:hypothetical protein
MPEVGFEPAIPMFEDSSCLKTARPLWSAERASRPLKCCRLSSLHVYDAVRIGISSSSSNNKGLHNKHPLVCSTWHSNYALSQSFHASVPTAKQVNPPTPLKSVLSWIPCRPLSAHPSKTASVTYYSIDGWDETNRHINWCRKANFSTTQTAYYLRHCSHS